MGLSRLIARLVVIAVPLAVSCGCTAAAAPPDPPGLLEVESVKHEGGPDGPTFNGGRPFVISINQKLPHAKAARIRLAARLHEAGQIDKFVFEWFGTDAPKRLNLV